MKHRHFFYLTGLLVIAAPTWAEIKVLTEHHANETATSAFKFKTVPAPSKGKVWTDDYSNLLSALAWREKPD